MSNVPLAGRRALQRFREKGLQRLLAPAALVILYTFFALFGRNFFSYVTLVNILDASYYIGFLAIGVTFVIITGGIDLSVGTVMMCATLIGGTAYNTWNWSMPLSLVLILVVATAFGTLNGYMVAKLKLPPFIATLGTMMVSMGVGSIVSNVRSTTFPTRAEPNGWFKDMFKIITDDFVSIPTGAVILGAAVIIAHVILTRTKMGRYIFAIGSNKEAARLSGVNVARWELSAYVISGIFAGVSGIAFAAVFTTILPAQGQGFELFAIAGAVIGGTSLAGGVGSVAGTLIGVLIMSTLRSGLPSMNLQAHYQTFFTGVVVIGAVLLDIYRTNRAARVTIATPADRYRTEMLQKIEHARAAKAHALAKGERETAATVDARIAQLKRELRHTYARMRREEQLAATRRQTAERKNEHAIERLAGDTPDSAGSHE